MRKVVLLAGFALLLPVSYTRADDFADHLAQLKAKNAGVKPPLSNCSCRGNQCSHACNVDCVDSSCPWTLKPKTKVGADGLTWYWTDEDGGYWWRYKDAPATYTYPVYRPAPQPYQPLFYSAGMGRFNGSCGPGG